MSLTKVLVSRNCDGSYHFKLYYPEMNGFNEWTQTSDPTTSKIVTDFKGLHIILTSDLFNLGKGVMYQSVI